MSTSRILWFTPSKGYSKTSRFLLDMATKKKSLNPANLFYANLSTKAQGLTEWKFRGKKLVEFFVEAKRAEATKWFDYFIDTLRPKIIVVNDIAALAVATGTAKYTLHLCRGSVYLYRGIPVIVTNYDASLLRVQKEFSWIFNFDLEKIKRWCDGKQRKEPKFVFNVCQTLGDVKSAFDFLSTSGIAAIDIETRKRIITCISYTGIVSGRLRTFVIPFLNPTRLGNCHWGDENEEVEVWNCIRKFHAEQSFKIFQNGSYDNAYFIKYRVPCANYFGDTAHAMHSIWTESPKKLNFISSLFLDHCQYWKDENKGDKEDAFPTTEANLQRYWRYCALDSYNTFLDFKILVQVLLSIDWALRNYKQEISLQLGPALAMSMRGVRVDPRRQRIRAEEKNKIFLSGLADLRVMTDFGHFNPFSNDHVAQLIYDVLGAHEIRGQRGKKAKGSRSVDEKILKAICDDPKQLPLIPVYVNKIWETKKADAEVAKYGPLQFDPVKEKWRGLELINGRFFTSYGAGGTETGRFNSSEHQFWVGGNAQNITIKAREMLVADPGYVFFDPDYTQSDAVFVAYESEDPEYIKTMKGVAEDGVDSHAIHCEHFFKIPYDKVVAGNKNDEEWCTHPTRGVRQNTKRIVHGSNFRMQGFTLYLQIMGREALVSCAKAMGFGDSGKWDQQTLVAFADKLIQLYYTKYKRLPVWFEQIVTECVKNGNTATSAFGRTRFFFGDVASDSGIHRELSAYFGQSGTAGNINRTLLEIYYESDIEKEGGLLHLQTHDSLTLQFPIDNLHTLAKKTLTIMQKKFTIKGRELFVATDAKTGLSWGKGLLKYRTNITFEEIAKHEAKIEEKYLRLAA